MSILPRYRTNMSITGVVCSPLLFLNVMGTQHMLHGLYPPSSVYLYSLIHHFLQITPNGNLHDSVNILPRYRTNMSITGVLCSPLLFLNVTGTHHILYDIYPPSSIYLYSVIHPHGNRTHAIWHFIHPKCRSIFANTLAFANHSEFKLAWLCEYSCSLYDYDESGLFVI